MPRVATTKELAEKYRLSHKNTIFFLQSAGVHPVEVKGGEHRTHYAWPIRKSNQALKGFRAVVPAKAKPGSKKKAASKHKPRALPRPSFRKIESSAIDIDALADAVVKKLTIALASALKK